MNSLYDLHSWSMLYREEELRDASRRHLEVGLRADRQERSRWSRVGLAWGRVLTLLRVAIPYE